MPYLNENIFLTEDKMLWYILNSSTEELTDFIFTNSFALYAVDFHKNVESMIETEEELLMWLETDRSICIELIKFETIYYTLPKTQ